MKVLTSESLFPIICKKNKKWGLHFHWNELGSSAYHFFRTAPWINENRLGAEEYWQIVIDTCGYLLFDTEEEVMEIFNQTIMDEVGENDTAVYACVYDPSGECVTENT